MSILPKYIPVSLVVPCFNRLHQTRKLLESIRDADFRCEIIIVDDNSKVNLKKLIYNFDDLDIKFQRNSCNYGPAFSRNQGIKLAQHDYIAFTDNDCLVDQQWLVRLYDALLKSEKSVAGIGGRVLAASNSIISQYFTYHKILDPWFHNGRYQYLVTANAIFRKSALLRVDGFDESITIAGGEDPGLGFKLTSAGYLLSYAPTAFIYHDYQNSFLSFLRTFFRYGYGCARQSSRYYVANSTKPTIHFAGIQKYNEES